MAAPAGEGPAEAGTVLRDPLAAEQSLTLGEALPGAPAVQGPASFFIILRMILVLILAAAAIYGIVYFLKKAVRPAGQRDSHLRVLASAHLGQNRFAHVVSVGTRAWLVGAGAGGVNLIAELEEQEAVDAMLLEESRRNAEAAPGRFLDFRAMLRRLGSAGNGRAPGAEPSAGAGLDQGSPPEPTAEALGRGSPPDNIRKRRERLKGL
ncbi:hypothetical protein AGMMS49587_05680 [Spirochaetia bacterium]|nr:hypothetical protein AGMMS49587_05680 [Spirochaetia bacterium]